MKIFDKLISRMAEGIIRKSGGWGTLWKLGQEWKLFGKSVNQPYRQDVNIFKAVKVIADNASQAEPAFYEWSSQEEIENKELQRLFRAPNSRQSFKDFIQEAVGHFALHGEVFIRKVDSLGQQAGTRNLPSELIVEDPKTFVEVLDGNRNLTGWKFWGGMLQLDQVIHIKDFNPYNKYRGLSPTEPLANEIDVDFRSMLYNKKFFDNDATPSMALMTDKNLNPEQRTRLEESYDKKHRGAQNAHRPTILEGGLKLESFGPTHKDMDFVEQKKFTREEILGTYRTPKALFNITESLNYATFTGQMKTFWIYCLVPILWKFEDALTRHLIMPFDPNLYFAFNLKSVPAFQEDFNSKVDTGIKLFNMGFTGNEINQKLELGFEEQEWRDYWWIQFGMAPAGEETEQNEQQESDPQAGKAVMPQQAHTVAPSVDKSTFFEQKLLKRFISGQSALEARFESKIKRFFFEQRKRLLERLTPTNVEQGEKLLNWTEENDLLKKVVRPILEKCVQEGIQIGKELLPDKKSISADLFNSDVASYIALRVEKITGINLTTQSRIQAQVEEGIKAGEAINAIADRVRDVFNMAASRAKLVARTETAGGVNGGSLLYYDSIGVEQKAWITANDEHVRESHRLCQAQGPVDMSDKFENGLEYPGDQFNGDAGEVCNCRCALRPIVN